MRPAGAPEASEPSQADARGHDGPLKSITPERKQQELDRGTTDFGFAFEDQARFRVSALKQKGHGVWSCA